MKTRVLFLMTAVLTLGLHFFHRRGNGEAAELKFPKCPAIS